MVVVLLAVAACGNNKASQVTPKDAGGRYGSGVDLEALNKTATPAPGSAASAPPAGGNTNSGAVTAPTTGAALSGIDVADDAGAVGRNAVPYLRGGRYTKLAFEITAANQWEPDPESISLLRTRLQSIVDKPKGIEFLPAHNFSSQKTKYSQDDIESLERQYRKRFSDKNGGTAVIHVLFLNGASEEFVGKAYRASSIVIMAEDADARSTAAVSRGKIEGAILVHEVGHLLRLLNNGYHSPREREDPEHRGHSRNTGSVMYWQVDASGDLIEDIFNGPPPNQFDKDDLADLADIKAGRLGPR